MGSSVIISEWDSLFCDPGGIMQVKIAGFCSASDCLASVWTREYSKQRTTELFQIEDSKTSYWSDNENGKLQSPERNSGKRSSNQESKREKSQRGKEGGENAVTGKQLDRARKETYVVTVMNPASGNRCDQRRKEHSSSPAPRAKAQDWRANTLQRLRSQRRALLEREERFRAKIFIGESVRIRHVIVGSLPCVSITSLNQDANMATIVDSYTLRLMPSQAKSRKVVRKNQFLDCRRLYKLGCVSQNSYRKTSILREEGRLRSTHAVKLSRGTWHQMNIRETNGPSQGVFQKCEPHERGLCAPRFEERSQEETLHQERCARGVPWVLAKIFTSPKVRIKLRFSPLLKPGQRWHPLKTSP